MSVPELTGKSVLAEGLPFYYPGSESEREKWKIIFPGLEHKAGHEEEFINTKEPHTKQTSRVVPSAAATQATGYSDLELPRDPGKLGISS